PRSFALFGLAVGLVTGLLAYAVTHYFVDGAWRGIAGQTALVFIGVSAASLLALADSARWLRGAAIAPMIGAAVAAPTWFMLNASIDANNLSAFPPMFWFLVGAPLTGLILNALGRAALAPRGDRYTALFAAGVALPMVGVGALLLGTLGVVLLYAWSALMRSMNVDIFHKVFQQDWFMLPFLGVVGGAAIGFMFSLERVLGALRYSFLLFARFAMPVAAALAVVFLAATLIKGPTGLFAEAFAGPALLSLAIAGMLLFNGVYQNGRAAPPPFWLRASTIVALLAFPVYAALAVSLFSTRIADLGMTPARLIGLVASGLVALYGLVGLAGVASELRWNAPRWMGVVAPLNAAMAALWALALAALATPVLNPWAMSAANRERLILKGRVDAATFDYGYLRFSLGASGRAALERLSAVPDHPQAAAIRAGAAAALAAPSYWVYKNGEPAAAREAPVNDVAAPVDPAPDAATPAEVPARGVDSLEFNP
ncbi:MAG: hypothetical protein K2Q06_16805, partial [Parvularculaceae bacterium]|nr:hypothetical protein [Parvularculaceae bacterium]